MLVLSRKTGESVVIGNTLCKITVLSIDRGKIRLGFEAMPEVPIFRTELLGIKPHASTPAPFLPIPEPLPPTN